MTLKWYALRTYSGHEKKVKAGIEKILKLRNLQDYVGDIHIPTVKVAQMRHGKKRVVEKKFMPGYILTQLDLKNDDIILAIKGVPSVSGFVGKPDVISNEEIQNLLQEDGSQEDSRDRAPTRRMFFQVGERVKIVDGPFMNFSGVVDEIMADKAKLKVKVEIFGQSTAVELDYLQVASNVG